jgi:hypothetical protein
MDRPIIAWFQNTQPGHVYVLTKLSAAPKIDLWNVTRSDGGLGTAAGTLKETLERSCVGEDWVLCEFENEISYLHALLAFKFQH